MELILSAGYFKTIAKTFNSKSFAIEVVKNYTNSEGNRTQQRIGWVTGSSIREPDSNLWDFVDYVIEDFTIKLEGPLKWN